MLAISAMNEGGGEGGYGAGVGSGFHGDFGWVEDVAEGVHIGVVCEEDGGSVQLGVVDEDEVGAFGDVGEGVEEKVESGNGREEEEEEEEG
ncbi:hypothetical protein C1H46_005023 [Malus baccata]|uniref:Uncharacterized protein n=1 Tax=Malus baccata TaxID=106549 RepID=A0A540NEE7_MALBA|nr:hypothetical protein C1H46_005023 [Malus baccata]